MPTSVSLREIRSAVRGGRRMAFTYQREKMVADFYMLGQARRTGAYIVVAWCYGPNPEWRNLYSLIHDLEPLDRIETYRADFDPYDPRIATVDCLALAFLGRRQHN